MYLMRRPSQRRTDEGLKDDITNRRGLKDDMTNGRRLKRTR